MAYADEREIQHALDAGALVIVVPTVDTVAEAIEARNYPVLQGGILFLAVIFVLVNLLVDLSYGYLNPRIRVS